MSRQQRVSASASRWSVASGGSPVKQAETVRRASRSSRKKRCDRSRRASLGRRSRATARASLWRAKQSQSSRSLRRVEAPSPAHWWSSPAASMRAMAAAVERVLRPTTSAPGSTRASWRARRMAWGSGSPSVAVNQSGSGSSGFIQTLSSSGSARQSRRSASRVMPALSGSTVQPRLRSQAAKAVALSGRMGSADDMDSSERGIGELVVVCGRLLRTGRSILDRGRAEVR